VCTARFSCTKQINSHGEEELRAPFSVVKQPAHLLPRAYWRQGSRCTLRECLESSQGTAIL